VSAIPIGFFNFFIGLTLLVFAHRPPYLGALFPLSCRRFCAVRSYAVKDADAVHPPRLLSDSLFAEFHRTKEARSFF